MKGESIKKCPICGLINPILAIQCDCGYNFPEIHQSLQEEYELKPINSSTKIICSVCGEDIKLSTVSR